MSLRVQEADALEALALAHEAVEAEPSLGTKALSPRKRRNTSIDSPHRWRVSMQNFGSCPQIKTRRFGPKKMRSKRTRGCIEEVEVNHARTAEARRLGRGGRSRTAIDRVGARAGTGRAGKNIRDQHTKTMQQARSAHSKAPAAASAKLSRQGEESVGLLTAHRPVFEEHKRSILGREESALDDIRLQHIETMSAMKAELTSSEAEALRRAAKLESVAAAEEESRMHAEAQAELQKLDERREASLRELELRMSSELKAELLASAEESTLSMCARARRSWRRRRQNVSSVGKGYDGRRSTDGENEGSNVRDAVKNLEHAASDHARKIAALQGRMKSETEESLQEQAAEHQLLLAKEKSRLEAARDTTSRSSRPARRP